MIPNALSPCITTAKVEESRDFYVQHFGVKVTFDCGWYVNLEFGTSPLPCNAWLLSPTKLFATLLY